MLAGFKKVGLSAVAMLVLGAIVGVLVGAVAGDYQLWVPVISVVGVSMGIAFGYGFLPES
jgi:uncharacterized membrane protein YoaK (UPF0700 family)